jgi:hypothetical protein
MNSPTYIRVGMDELYPIVRGPICYPQAPYILCITGLIMMCLSVIYIKEFPIFLFLSLIFFVLSAITQIVLFHHMDYYRAL